MNLGPFENQVKPGIAVVCAVKNRTEPLRYSIPAYLMLESVKQFVLVDWDSRIPAWYLLNEMDIPCWPDKRVVSIRVHNQPHWNSAKAYNLAMRFVNRNLTLKTDADVVPVSKFESIPKSGVSFVTGNWRNATGSNEWFLHGAAFFGTKDYWRIGGYDERFTAYGFEDDNFYERLTDSDLIHRNFRPKEFFHLPHTDQKRTEHHAKQFKDLSTSSDFGRRMSARRSKWTRSSPQTRYEIVYCDKSQKLCEVIETN